MITLCTHTHAHSEKTTICNAPIRIYMKAPSLLLCKASDAGSEHPHITRQGRVASRFLRCRCHCRCLSVGAAARASQATHSISSIRQRRRQHTWRAIGKRCNSLKYCRTHVAQASAAKPEVNGDTNQTAGRQLAAVEERERGESEATERA